MGVEEIEGELTTFGELIPGLQAGRFDLAASAIYIKPDRCEQVAFAEPLYIQGDSIIVAAGNPKNIHSYSDVAADPTIKLGYPTGGTGVGDNAKAMGVTDDQLVDFPDSPAGFARCQTLGWSGPTRSSSRWRTARSATASRASRYAWRIKSS